MLPLHLLEEDLQEVFRTARWHETSEPEARITDLERFALLCWNHMTPIARHEAIKAFYHHTRP